MNEEENHPLDANLERLIQRENLPPTPSAAQKGAMLGTLLEKQADIARGRSPRPQVRVLRRNLTIAGQIAALFVVGFFVVKRFDAPAETTAPQPSIAGRPTAPAVPEVPAIKNYAAAETTQRIQLRDGSIAIAQQGTTFTELAPRKLKLESGSLYLLVAKADTPLEVGTPRGKALALGTRFVISNRGNDTRVAVSQGTVRFENSKGGVDLSRGEQGSIDPWGIPKRGPAPRVSYLVNWAREALQKDEFADVLQAEDDKRGGLLAVDPNGQEVRLELRRYTLDVYIEGGVARTTIDQTFFNHHHGNTEGTFFFPLPPGASVSRMAMYVNGKRNEAGMVERGRGQQIYNDIKYANRDPALLEQLEGNLYKLRIFPLEGRREKRIFISCTQTLDELYHNIRYWFPMDHTSDNAGRVEIKVRIRFGAELYDARSSTHQFESEIDGDDLLLSYSAENIKPDQDLLLNLLPKEKQKKVAQSATLEKDGTNYLHTRIRPEIFGLPNKRARQWFIINDASASRSRTDILAQAHILDRLLAEGDDGDQIAILNLNTEARRLTEKLVPLDSAAARAAVAAVRRNRRLGGRPISKTGSGRPTGGSANQKRRIRSSSTSATA